MQRKIIFFIALLFAVQTQINPTTFSTVSGVGSTVNALNSICPNNCCRTKTISVSGSSTETVTPDTANIQVTANVNGPDVTTVIARLAQVVSRIITVLNANGLTNSNYQVTDLNVYPNYTTNSVGVSVISGQIATETFQVTLNNIGNGSSIGKLIDGLAAVNGITINGLSYDIANKTAINTLARKDALAAALSKAQDYTQAAGLSLGKVVQIVDTASVYVPSNNPRPVFDLAVSSAKVSTTVNVGTVDVTYNIQAVYAYA